MSAIAYLASAGCLPDIEPAEFDTIEEAWAYVAEEVETIEDDGDYLAAHTMLHMANHSQPGLIPAGEDTLYAWHVEEVED